MTFIILSGDSLRTIVVKKSGTMPRKSHSKATQPEKYGC
jgi:hypothetical protein